MPRGREAAAARREASQQTAGGASSSYSAYFPPSRDGGAPRKIPCNDAGSDVSSVIHECGICKIRASAIVVIDPFALPPLMPLSDVLCVLLAVEAPVATGLIMTGAGPRQTRGKRQARQWRRW